jgi:hypothetical protein
LIDGNGAEGIGRGQSPQDGAVLLLLFDRRLHKFDI